MTIKKELEMARLSEDICKICNIDFKRKHFYSNKEYENQEYWTYEYLNFYEPHNFVTLIELQIDGCIPLGYFILRSCRENSIERLHSLLTRSHCEDTQNSIKAAIWGCKEWKYQTGIGELDNDSKKD